MTESTAAQFPGIPPAIAALTLWLDDEHDTSGVDAFVKANVASGEEAAELISGLLAVAGRLLCQQSATTGLTEAETLRQLAIDVNLPPG